MYEYNFNKEVDFGRLALEIMSSSISAVRESFTKTTPGFLVTFRAELTSDEIVILNTLVENHINSPLPTPKQTVVVEQTSEPEPFAKPSYRTKRNATEDVLMIMADGEESVDYKLKEERYVSGGEIVTQGSQMGDYIRAMVYDKDGIIPEEARASTCENWPIVAEYIEKHWVGVGNRVISVDTYPLNAKVPAGLYLRVIYKASATPGTREAAVNYYLTKKL